MIVEVQTDHREVRLRLFRLLFDRQRAMVLVELDDAVALRIVHAVREYGRPLGARVRALQRFREAMAVEDVVAEDETTRMVADEVGADEKRLRQTSGIRLLGVREPDAPLRPVAE